MRTIAILFGCILLSGCGCMPPLKSESTAFLYTPKPVRANVEAVLNSLPDTGPLFEVAVPPCTGDATKDKVALIDVDGLLLNLSNVGPFSMGENPVALFQEKLTAAACDPGVKAVVLRLNSPGGSVAATEVMGRSLADFRRQTGKPVVACLLDEAAGGAYYLASGCDQIVAIPSAVVGGIGVMLNLYFLELTMEQYNVFGNPIKAGDRIDMGSPNRKMTPAEKQMLTEMAREYHENFKRVVLDGRPQVKPESPVFDGRVVAASQAEREGLIDAVGFLPDAIDKAKEMTKAGGAKTIMYRRDGSPARSVYSTVPNQPSGQGSLMNASVPGLDRSKLPLFLYLWQVEPTVVKSAAIH